MGSLVRALFVGAVATAGFAALVTAVAPEALRAQLNRGVRFPDDAGPSALDRVLNDEVDADDLSDVQALSLLRELARDLDLDAEPA